MKRFMTGVFAVACAGALCVGLVACGGGSSSAGSSAASASSASASASASASESASASASSSAASSSAASADEYVDPATINPGWLDSDVRTSDTWYLDGDPTAGGIYFTNAANDAGLSYTKVDANDQDGDSEFNLVITEDKHLRTPEGTAPKIDIVFDDVMNCYDYVSGNFYSRGDLNELKAAVAGNTYVAEDGSGAEIVVNEDGTFVLSWKGKTDPGTWEIAASTVVEMTYDSDNYTEEYRMTIEDGVATRIMDGGWQYYALKK